MLGPLILALSLGLSPASADEEDEGYRMNDVGGTVSLPAGYASESWADWELKAKSSKGVLFKLWLTPYQFPVTDETTKAFGEIYAKKLEKEGVSEVAVEGTEIQERGGRAVGIVELSMSISGGSGVAFAAFTPSNGQTVHLRTVAARRLKSQARADLDELLGTLELDQGAIDAPTTVSTDAGFEATLPDGWRPPVGKELDPVRKITGKVGESELSPERCWAGIRPTIGDDPDVMFACKMNLYIGPLDEHSFEGVEAELHDTFFGRSDKPVDAGLPVTVGDRMGVLFQPPVAGGPVRLALAPYEGAMMQAWALGNTMDADLLDGAVRSTMASTTFTGPDGGAPIIGFDKWVAYYLQYRPTSPLVLGPGLLLVGLIGAGVLVARRKPSYDDVE